MGNLVNPFAISGLTGGGGGGTLPGIIDFVAGTASIGGSSVSISGVTNHPELISGSGLDISSTFPKLIGAMRSLWIAQTTFTVVCEFSYTSVPSEFEPLFMETAGGGYPAWYIDQYSYATTVVEADTNFITAASYVSIASPVKVAATRTAGRAALSVSGNAVDSATNTANTMTFTDVYLGGSTSWGSASWTGYIRKLAIYAPQLDADLPTLSS